MKTKTLYLLVNNGGDGSYSVSYVMDPEVIRFLDNAESNGKLDYDSPGCDGDGFHYDTLEIPVECTEESLGISVMTMEDAKNMIDDEEEEDEG